MCFDKSRWQCQELTEYVTTKIADNAAADPTQRILRSESSKSPAQKYDNEPNRNPLNGFKVLRNQPLISQRPEHRNHRHFDEPMPEIKGNKVIAPKKAHDSPVKRAVELSKEYMQLEDTPIVLGQGGGGYLKPLHKKRAQRTGRGLQHSSSDTHFNTSVLSPQQQTVHNPGARSVSFSPSSK